MIPSSTCRLFAMLAFEVCCGFLVKDSDMLPKKEPRLSLTANLSHHKLPVLQVVESSTCFYFKGGSCVSNWNLKDRGWYIACTWALDKIPYDDVGTFSVLEWYRAPLGQ